MLCLPSRSECASLAGAVIAYPTSLQLKHSPIIFIAMTDLSLRKGGTGRLTRQDALMKHFFDANGLEALKRLSPVGRRVMTLQRAASSLGSRGRSGPTPCSLSQSVDVRKWDWGDLLAALDIFATIDDVKEDKKSPEGTPRQDTTSMPVALMNHRAGIRCARHLTTRHC